MANKLPSIVMPAKLLEHVNTHGGVVALSYTPELEQDRWAAAYHFGRETQNSPVAAGAAYGTGATAADAFGEMLKEAGIW